MTEAEARGEMIDRKARAEMAWRFWLDVLGT